MFKNIQQEVAIINENERTINCTYVFLALNKPRNEDIKLNEANILVLESTQ